MQDSHRFPTPPPGGRRRVRCKKLAPVPRASRLRGPRRTELSAPTVSSAPVARWKAVWCVSGVGVGKNLVPRSALSAPGPLECPRRRQALRMLEAAAPGSLLGRFVSAFSGAPAPQCSREAAPPSQRPPICFVPTGGSFRAPQHPRLWPGPAVSRSTQIRRPSHSVARPRPGDVLEFKGHRIQGKVYVVVKELNIVG
ncbi:hypothetical protein NDU88_003920 [Pleurodeles waltl]|uniref:Uncharacterized protein n=1 Tax=Pleurodeles waltl TaxID=8319 RepID=A0AAV7MVQ2_PLEWA|nr:hypothetical protein NDU88_003920 [Pleurodeles waltl]